MIIAWRPNTFPAAVDDCFAVVEWVSATKTPSPVTGKSALPEKVPANLAAVMALMARDREGPSIAFQGLLYPVTDCSMSQQSYAENGEGFILETPLMQWFGMPIAPTKQTAEDPRATPIHAQSLANLPSALVITAEFDPLRDEGEAYGDALNAAGSPAEIIRCDGLVHDFSALLRYLNALEAAVNSVEQLRSISTETARYWT